MDMMKRHCQRLNGYRILVVVSLCGLAASRHCDHLHYWDSQDRLCRPCTKCPLNEIIRKPCGRHSNTKCGPFREFRFFQLDDVNPAYTSYEYETFFNENSSGLDNARELSGSRAGRQNDSVVEKDDGEYWKSLAFALIGVVCVLIFVATVVVLMACKKLHENTAIKRPEEEDDDDSGYVVIRAIRPPNMSQRGPAPLDMDQCSAARGLLMGDDVTPVSQNTPFFSQRQEFSLKGVYTPVRHLLNYDADDVFESEDSAESGTSCQVLPQQTIDSSVKCTTDRASVSDEMPL